MTETTNITHPHSEFLLDEYRAVCEKIPKATSKAEKQIRIEIAESTVRGLRGEKKRIRSTTRLTSEQQDIARKRFRSFWERMKDYDTFFEENIGKGGKISPYYDAFTYTRLALESYTRSMFSCFRCGEITSVSNLKVKNRIAYHQCDDDEMGHGNRTSWLYLYATFVRNKYYKKAFDLLNQILNAHAKK